MVHSSIAPCYVHKLFSHTRKKEKKNTSESEKQRSIWCRLNCSRSLQPLGGCVFVQQQSESRHQCPEHAWNIDMCWRVQSVHTKTCWYEAHRRVKSELNTHRRTARVSSTTQLRTVGAKTRLKPKIQQGNGPREPTVKDAEVTELPRNAGSCGIIKYDVNYKLLLFFDSTPAGTWEASLLLQRLQPACVWGPKALLHAQVFRFLHESLKAKRAPFPAALTRWWRLLTWASFSSSALQRCSSSSSSVLSFWLLSYITCSSCSSIFRPSHCRTHSHTAQTPAAPRNHTSAPPNIKNTSWARDLSEEDF